MLESNTHRLLDRDQSRRLAGALMSKPETTIDIHCLIRGLGRAYVLGEPSAFDAAVIEADYLPAEPDAYGVSADKIFELLRDLRGWDCVLVEEELPAAGLSLGISRREDAHRSGRQVRTIGRHYALRRNSAFKSTAVPNML